MIASLLLHLADAEEVVDTLAANSGVTLHSESLDSNDLEKSSKPHSANAGREETSGSGSSTLTTEESSVHKPEVEEESGQTDELQAEGAYGNATSRAISEPEMSSLLELRVEGQPVQWQQHAATKASDLLEQHDAKDAGSPLDPPEILAPQKTGRENKYGSDYELQKAKKVDEQSLQNAEATMKHLRQQLSLLNTHVSAFTWTFHMLLSLAQLPPRLYVPVAGRVVDYLSRVVLGGPREKVKRWAHRISGKLRRRRRVSVTETSQAPPETQTEIGNIEGSGTDKSFSTVFLPVSVERAVERIRKEWKSLAKTDYLSVRSSACMQDADLWKKDETEANDKAAGAGGDQLVPDALLLAAHVEEHRDSRRELCTHILWLDLHARISIEQHMLEEGQLFPYFARMGIENVELVKKSASQGTSNS